MNKGVKMRSATEKLMWTWSMLYLLLSLNSMRYGLHNELWQFEQTNKKKSYIATHWKSTGHFSALNDKKMLSKKCDHEMKYFMHMHREMNSSCIGNLNLDIT